MLSYICENNFTFSALVDRNFVSEQSLKNKQSKRSTVNKASASLTIQFIEGTKRDERFISDWWTNVEIAEEYKTYRKALFYVLRPFQAIWDERFVTKNTVMFRVDLISSYIRPKTIAPHRADTKVRKSEKEKMDWVWKGKVTEHAQAE